MSISRNRLKAFKQFASDGLLELPPDDRDAEHRKEREKPAMVHANSFLNWCYFEVAEPLAETKLELENATVPTSTDKLVDVTDPERIAKHLPSSDSPNKPVFQLN